MSELDNIVSSCINHNQIKDIIIKYDTSNKATEETIASDVKTYYNDFIGFCTAKSIVATDTEKAIMKYLMHSTIRDGVVEFGLVDKGKTYTEINAWLNKYAEKHLVSEMITKIDSDLTPTPSAGSEE